MTRGGKWVRRSVASTFVAVLGMAAAGMGAPSGLWALAPRVALAAPDGGSGSTFQLNSFTATPVAKTTDEFYLDVTVSQNSADGSDFTPGSDTETHPFPQNLYFYVADNTGRPVSTLFDATLVFSSPSGGITYSRSESGAVTGTAEYEVTIPSGAYTSGDELLIYPYGTPNYKNQQYAFRMGNPSDNSFADDVVGGTTNFPIPVNDLPEVPFAVLLPAMSILGVSLVMLQRRRAART